MIVQGLVKWVLKVNEALVVEATNFEGRFSSPPSPPSSIGSPICDIRLACQGEARPPLGTLDYGCRPLRMMLQDGRTLDLMGSATKGPSSKELVVKAKELKANKALEA